MNVFLLKMNRCPNSCTEFPEIRLLIGLGNPGEIYHMTRHNTGFYALDKLIKILDISFTFSNKFLGYYAGFKNRLHLLKPATYMNNSGQSVHAFMKFHNLNPEQILVIHDELDLMPGRFKFKKNGGLAGHNGLKSVKAAIGSQNFWRLRIGIGHPNTINVAQRVDSFVLSRPSKKDQESIDNIINHCCNLACERFFSKE